MSLPVMSVIPTNWNATSPSANVESIAAAELPMKNMSPLYTKVAVALPAVKSDADIKPLTHHL